eukprot:g1825.t1
MLLPLMRALLVTCLVRPLGICCAAASSPATAARGSFLAKRTNRDGVGGRQRTTPNGSSGQRQAELRSGRALCIRGGDAGEALEGQRKKWWKGVNRKPLPAPEALSRYPSLKTPGGLVRLLDYVGTVSFAMSGAATAGLRGMNLLGCVFVGVLAATGGGTLRDLLLGQTPVFWLVEVEYVTICVVTAVVTFFFWPILSRVPVLSHMGTGMDGWLSQAIDTIGLASFAVAGTQHGIRRAAHPGITIIICCITCSGGGILRDVLTSSPVMVLSSHAQMYVSTTAFGSAAYLYARRRSRDPLTRICAGFFTVIVLRALACVYDLRLPLMRGRGASVPANMLNLGGDDAPERESGVLPAAAREKKALLTLWWCTNGPGWIDAEGWEAAALEEVEEELGDSWFGVGLDPAGRDGVTLVDLRRNGLHGAMPPDIGHLTGLTHLYLGDNQLSGSIPKSIGQLSRLCILSLRGNNLKGDIVPELGYLSALQTLSLRDNHFTGILPPELGKLTALRHLFLNNNNLQGPIPEELSQLENLEQLFLSDNGLEGSIPESFGRLFRLEELVLSGNQLTGPIPVELADLVRLVRLELDGNELSGDIPPAMGALSNLKSLYLNANGLSGPIPPELGMLSAMERLDLSKNQLTGSIPAELGHLFELELLILNDNKLVGGIPVELGRLHHITLLLLHGNQLSEAPPIVGGNGLRQWQVCQRKAYLNSWSLVERLTQLEKENAQLKKENNRLRKMKSASAGRATPLTTSFAAAGLAGAKQPAANGSAAAAAAAAGGGGGGGGGGRGGTSILAEAGAAGGAKKPYDVDDGGSLAPLLVPSDWGSNPPPFAAADLSTAPPSCSPGEEADGAHSTAAGTAVATPTAPRPPRSAAHSRVLRSRHPSSTGEDDERVDVDRAAARRALLNSSGRRMSGGSDGGYSSGGSGSAVGGGSRSGGRSAARRGSDEEGGGGPGTGGHTPPSQSSEPSSREGSGGVGGGVGGGGAFFSFSPGFRSGSSPAGEGEGGTAGAGAGLGKTFSKRPEHMLSPLRSPMLRQEGGESTGSGRPAAAAAAAASNSDPPAAKAVPTEEAFDAAYGRRWAALMGLVPSAAAGGASASSNGVPASSGRAPASNNGVPRATNGVGTHADSGAGASSSAANGVGAGRSSENGVGSTLRSRAVSDSDGGVRAASPLGQMVLGLFRGVGSPAQTVGPSAFAPVAIGTKTDDINTDAAGKGDNGRPSPSGAAKTAAKGGNPKPE